MRSSRLEKPAPGSATKRGGSGRAPRPRVAVGPPRPQYLLSEENDRMMMIITALAAEVSSLRDRLDTHEALAEKRRFATAAEVDCFRLTDSRQAARERSRQQMLSRVFRVVFEDLDVARQADRLAASALLEEEVGAE